ncbi:MAG: hypothetical protein ABR575_11960 [Actinomycetota bacterium]
MGDGFRWVPHDADGSDMDATETFATRQEAEDWMGREWESLLEGGAEHVSLVDDAGTVYYRMGLRAG